MGGRPAGNLCEVLGHVHPVPRVKGDAEADGVEPAVEGDVAVGDVAVEQRIVGRQGAVHGHIFPEIGRVQCAVPAVDEASDVVPDVAGRSHVLCVLPGYRLCPPHLLDGSGPGSGSLGVDHRQHLRFELVNRWQGTGRLRRCGGRGGLLAAVAARPGRAAGAGRQGSGRKDGDRRQGESGSYRGRDKPSPAHGPCPLLRAPPSVSRPCARLSGGNPTDELSVTWRNCRWAIRTISVAKLAAPLASA